MTHVIKSIRSFYGPTTKTSLVKNDENGMARKFESAAAAREYIKTLEAEVYHTAHNESGRPEYKVSAISSLPQYLKYEL